MSELYLVSEIVEDYDPCIVAVCKNSDIAEKLINDLTIKCEEVNKKAQLCNECEYDRMCYVDDGCNGCMNETLEEHASYYATPIKYYETDEFN